MSSGQRNQRFHSRHWSIIVGTKLDPKTLVSFDHLTRLITGEDFIEPDNNTCNTWRTCPPSNEGTSHDPCGYILLFHCWSDVCTSLWVSVASLWSKRKPQPSRKWTWSQDSCNGETEDWKVCPHALKTCTVVVNRGLTAGERHDRSNSILCKVDSCGLSNDLSSYFEPTH